MNLSAIKAAGSTKAIVAVMSLFLVGCSHEAQDRILVNEALVLKKISESSRPMDNMMFKSDLNMHFTRSDYLPAGWDIADTLIFYALERWTSERNGMEFILYARVVARNQKVWDARIATLEQEKVRYNFPVWQNSFTDKNYTNIYNWRGAFIAEIYQEGEKVATYFMEQGVLEE
jgi:hypothetical protein